MTKYFCDKCGAEIARSFDIEYVTFRMEWGSDCSSLDTISVDMELCHDCLSKATKTFKDLINKM